MQFPAIVVIISLPYHTFRIAKTPPHCAINKLSAASTITLIGPLIYAEVAAPPSPLYPEVPVPATVFFYSLSLRFFFFFFYGDLLDFVLSIRRVRLMFIIVCD